VSHIPDASFGVDSWQIAQDDHPESE